MGGGAVQKSGMTAEQRAEWLRCAESSPYFIDRYCQIYDATLKQWIPFKLWQEQYETLVVIEENAKTIILKARQLGLTWLLLGYVLWLMLFYPAATVLLFSKRDTEAVYLIDERLKGMFKRLPDWMCEGVTDWVVEKDNDHQWELSNGSKARAFPTTAGDSYTATVAIVDEADLVPDLAKLLRSVQPTIDGGGKLILLSRSDKSAPNSTFKNIYRAAKAKASSWACVFLPWWVRPERDQAWYEQQKADIEQNTGSLDDLHEQYPATDNEALAPRTLDKRISPLWLNQCYVEVETRQPSGAPAIPGLVIYKAPYRRGRYVVGGDPAEGNPGSDPSAATVLDIDTGEEVAKLWGRIEPDVFAGHIKSLSQYFNNAPAMIERNNHGHVVLLWLRDNSNVRRLVGLDGKAGWMSSSRGKTAMYDAGAGAFRDKETTIHSFDTLTQLQSIEGATLKAPEGDEDDLADSYVLALIGIERYSVGDDPPPPGAHSFESY